MKSAIIYFLPFLFLGSLLGMATGTRVFVKVWYDPQFCTSCHVHDYANESWTKTPHGNVATCMNCHEQPLYKYPLQVASWIFRRPHFPQDLKKVPVVKSATCKKCHEMDNSFEHSLHLKVAGVECASCHGTEYNRPHILTVADQACAECHSEAHDGKFTKSYGCRVCHSQDFLTPARNPEPKRQRYEGERINVSSPSVQ